MVLHDHLDGGLRPETVAELADAVGYDGLPDGDPDALRRWFRRGAAGGDLVQYLAGFSHTVAVMQTTDALHRVAVEFVQDLARDGVVLAELRFAPERHTAGGLSLDDVLEAVTAGLASAARETNMEVGAIVSIMRDGPNAKAVAEAAVRWRERGVVAVDLAGPEDGHPPDAHFEGLTVCHEASLPITVHAGEGAGLGSIRLALHPCGADRIGHGVRIIEDIQVGGDGTHVLGRLATYVRDRRIPLELCPTSNVDTGVSPSFEEHPLPLLRSLGFHVTLNPDNRLMSDVTLTSEMTNAVNEWHWGPADLEALTIAAADAAFLSDPRRRSLIQNVIRPGWAKHRHETPS